MTNFIPDIHQSSKTLHFEAYSKIRDFFWQSLSRKIMANFKIPSNKEKSQFHKSQREILEMFRVAIFLRWIHFEAASSLLCCVAFSLLACACFSLFRVRREILAPAVTLHSTLTVNCMEFARSEVQWPRTSLGLSTLFRPPIPLFPTPIQSPKPFSLQF